MSQHPLCVRCGSRRRHRVVSTRPHRFSIWPSRRGHRRSSGLARHPQHSKMVDPDPSAQRCRIARGPVPWRGRRARRIAKPVGNRSVSRPVLARIDHVATVASPTQFLSGHPPDGKGQFEILRTLNGAMGAPAAAHGSSSIRMVKCFARTTGDAAWFVFREHAEQRARKRMSGIPRLHSETSGRRPAPWRRVWR